MTREDRKSAKKLATSYAAFNAACDKKDAEGAKVWAKLLIDAQKATGVEMIDARTLEWYCRDDDRNPLAA